MDFRSPIAKALLPTNVRLLASSLTGERSPITNADFSDDELATLRQLYTEKKAFNDARANPTLPTKEQFNYRRFHEGDYRAVPNDRATRPLEYEEWLARKKAEAAPYQKNVNKTSIGYDDYSKLSEMNATRENIIDTLKKLYNPAYNLSTTVGAINGYDMGDKVQLRDMYDFDTSADIYRNRPAKFSDLWNHPVELIDRYASQQGISRPVNIEWQK